MGKAYTVQVERPHFTAAVDVMNAVLIKNGFCPEVVFSPSRLDKHVNARTAAIAFLKHNTFMTLCYIGGVVNRDHTTVIKALRKFEVYKDYYPDNIMFKLYDEMSVDYNIHITEWWEKQYAKS